MSSADYVVIWDGTRDKGRQLFVEEPIPAPPVVKVPHVTATSIVLRLRPSLTDWFTVADLEALTQLSPARIHNALANLWRQGQLDRERKGCMTRKVQRYKFMERGR